MRQGRAGHDHFRLVIGRIYIFEMATFIINFRKLKYTARQVF